MKKFALQLLFAALLVVVAALAQAQDKVMLVHSGGSVAYAVNASQVDSVTFRDGNLPASLINTKWKLTGIVDAKTGAVTELGPKDCRECYTLSFGTDYTAIVNSIYLPLRLDLLNLTPYVISDDMLRYAEWYGNVKYEEALDFRKAMAAAESCAGTEDELKLYYNDKKNCLLFNPLDNNAEDDLNDLITSNLSKKGVVDPELLIGGWDFVTYAYTEDGITISDIPTEPKGWLQIKNTKANSYESRWEFKYQNTVNFECSLSGNLIRLTSILTTLLPNPPEENLLKEALNYAYSFVIKGDELLLYYTGADDKNLLILKKRQE